MSLLLHQRRIQIWLIILKWKNFFSRQNRICQEISSYIGLTGMVGWKERLKFNYDGTDLYLLAVKVVWGMNDNPSIVYVSYTRIEE